MGTTRNVAGLVAGVVVSQAVVFAVETIGTTLYPPPPAADSADAAALAAWMLAVPSSLKVLVVVGWLLGGIAGPWVALRVTKRPWAGWTITALFLAVSLFNLATLPHPAWMIACGVAFPLLGGWIAQRYGYSGAASPG